MWILHKLGLAGIICAFVVMVGIVIVIHEVRTEAMDITQPDEPLLPKEDSYCDGDNPYKAEFEKDKDQYLADRYLTVPINKAVAGEPVRPKPLSSVKRQLEYPGVAREVMVVGVPYFTMFNLSYRMFEKNYLVIMAFDEKRVLNEVLIIEGLLIDWKAETIGTGDSRR